MVTTGPFLFALRWALEITSVKFRNFKALRDFSISLSHINVLVGPNNSGKSTILGAFRVLASAIRKARTRSPAFSDLGVFGTRYSYVIDAADVPVSLENAHTDYSEGDSTVTFRLSNGDNFVLVFPLSGGCRMFVEAKVRAPREPKVFRSNYPVTIGVVPVLGPVEHDETLLQKETVQAALLSHRASRHFRNYWHHFPDGFERFQGLVAKTWPEMEIRRPELVYGANGTRLVMFCRENRIDRELYWIGSGFQIWCQLLTHAMRSNQDSLMVVDEPEIYLHPDMQRQLLSVFRESGPSLLLATHSSELVAEAEPSDILLVNKRSKSARRLDNVEAMQSALEHLGSAHNITLTQLARTRRLVFVEGDDFRLIRRFAERAGFQHLASGLDLVPVAVGGFGQWSRVPSAGWTFQNALGQPVAMAAVFDRDYYCDEEVAEVETELNKVASVVSIHKRKEIENYLLIPEALNRCVTRALAKRSGASSGAIDVAPLLEGIVEELRQETTAQLIGKAMDYFRRPGRSINNATISAQALERCNAQWRDLASKLAVTPGKEVLSRLNKKLQETYGVSITPSSIISCIRKEEIPSDLAQLLAALDEFRTKPLPEH